jgi:ligand-binding sensor domain-containing protein/serine phosphatase RsbU (regulator of sigma subunit)
MFFSIKKHTKTYLNLKSVLFVFFSVLTTYTLAQDFKFRNFNLKDGLAQLFVYSITQDEHGYLWVGTGNGLSRYNGLKFDNFTTIDSLADNFVTCAIGDGDCLWFGHMNGRLSYFNGRTFHPVNIPQTNSGPATHFAKSPDGRIWVSTYSDGLYKLRNTGGIDKHYSSADHPIIISFDFLSDSELLVGTNTGLLYATLKDSGEIEIRSASDIPESKVTSIRKMRNSSGFYVATENEGIFHLTNETGLFKVSKIIADTNFEFSDIQDIYEDSQANLWICSKGGGLARVTFSSSGSVTKFDHFDKASGFVSDNVKTVYEDREGNIWSGNYGEGLTQITLKTFSVLKFDNTLFGNDIFSFYFNRQFRWIGTENGLLKMDPSTGKILNFYSKGSGLLKDTVTALYSADGKELWIGTEKHGLYKMEAENEKILKYPFSNGILENSINTVKGKGDQVWVGTKKGLYNINSVTGKINLFSINIGGLPHNYINCLYLDKRNRLWVSTPGNMLAYIQDEKVVKIPINVNNGILTLGPITEDSDSTIWIGTKGNGIFMIKSESDSIANLTVKEGLFSNYCYSIIYDDQKNIWVGHKGGLSRIRITDFSVKSIQDPENIMDNCNFNPNALTMDQQGKIWLGSNMGLVSYDPTKDYSNLQSPVLGITSIKINDTERDYTDKIVLSPGNYKIRIDFIGISLKEPSLVTYQYKLDGYDQWSDITKNTSITYPRLTEGNYTFILKAASGDGVVTENPLTINIIIKVPLWKKSWFYIFTVSLLIILTLIYIKKREYKFLAEKRILEEKVRERTKEIQCQKNEIELQRDLIEKKNASITSSIKYASHIQNAVLTPIELINKMFPDNFILSKPKDIVSGDFYWFTKKDNKIVFTVADCTGHGVPGAFMSLLGITLLNEIVNIQGIIRSDAIVTMLRERVIHSLQQSREAVPTSDGMDMSLCVLDKARKKIQYTGAMNNLVLIREGKLEIIKADRFSVSVTYGNSCHFTMKEINYLKGDIVYLFSDGYQDQFGGNFNKKFLSQNFYLILLEIYKLPMSSQREFLERKLDDWMKGNIQTDDITVIGIRL